MTKCGQECEVRIEILKEKGRAQPFTAEVAEGKAGEEGNGPGLGLRHTSDKNF
jgi:hypothetical protein